MMTDERFTELLRAHMDTVYRLALSCMKDPAGAEDVSQEVFLRLLRKAPDFESREHERYWLLRVTVNECKRALASPWKARVQLDENLCTTDAGDGSRELYELVMALPEKYRVVLHLHYYEGYSSAEIAGILKRPGATVRSQLARGRKLLKQELMEVENV